jgi:hypothetical protein
LTIYVTLLSLRKQRLREVPRRPGDLDLASPHQEVLVTSNPSTRPATPVDADDIPVAHTPPGGYGETMPPPVLANCTEPLPSGVPDLRGLWQVVTVEVDAVPDPAHRALGLLQRVEQCADRLVVTGGGVVHDMRCDGTEAGGVHDVAEFDFVTPITVIATYEHGVHVLRPQGIPIEVTRRRDGDQMVWTYLDFTARLDRLGPPDHEPPVQAQPKAAN